MIHHLMPYIIAVNIGKLERIPDGELIDNMFGSANYHGSPTNFVAHGGMRRVSAEDVLKNKCSIGLMVRRA